MVVYIAFYNNYCMFVCCTIKEKTDIITITGQSIVFKGHACINLNNLKLTKEMQCFIYYCFLQYNNYIE